MNVKICGITTIEDAYYAAQAGANMLGFNFYKKSPRYIAPEAAAEICAALRQEAGEACPILVGVFVNELVSMISVVTRKVGLDAAQLHGDESNAVIKELHGMAYKAVRPDGLQQAWDDLTHFQPYFTADERLPCLLLDAYHPNLYGGTGEQASTELALAMREYVPRMMLAGGLTPENVTARVQHIQPWGVDTASGVEYPGMPGRKDPARMQAFVQAAWG